MLKNSKYLFAASALVALCAGMAHAQDDISYAQVLRDPGNLALNFAFAEQRLEEGDLVSASATLERILFQEPNWDEARLLYAGVLYRLGDHDAAKRELALLEGRTLAPETQQKFDAYNGRVASASADTRWSGRVSAGVGYDENAGILITEDVGGNPTLDGVDQYSFVVRGALQVEHDISEAENRQLFAKADFYTKQFEDSELDGYIVTTGRAGLQGSGATLDYQVNLSARNVNIQGSNYLKELGVEGRLSRDLGARTVIGASAGFHEQDFSSVFGTGDASEGRSGDRLDGAVFVKHALGARTRAFARLDLRDKAADVEDFAYTSRGGQIGLEHFFANNAYIDTDLVFREYEYKGSFGSSVGDREDEFTFARAAFGVPLCDLIGRADQSAENPLMIEAAIYRTDRQSNIEIFEFDSTGGEIRLIWKFGR